MKNKLIFGKKKASNGCSHHSLENFLSLPLAKEPHSVLPYGIIKFITVPKNCNKKLSIQCYNFSCDCNPGLYIITKTLRVMKKPGETRGIFRHSFLIFG